MFRKKEKKGKDNQAKMTRASFTGLIISATLMLLFIMLCIGGLLQFYYWQEAMSNWNPVELNSYGLPVGYNPMPDPNNGIYGLQNFIIGLLGSLMFGWFALVALCTDRNVNVKTVSDEDINRILDEREKAKVEREAVAAKVKAEREAAEAKAKELEDLKAKVAMLEKTG